MLIALVRGVGDLGPDGVLEVSSAMVMAVMLVMTKKWLKSNHDNVLKFLTVET